MTTNLDTNVQVIAARRALRALFLETPESVATEVQRCVEEAFASLAKAASAAETECVEVRNLFDAASRQRDEAWKRYDEIRALLPVHETPCKHPGCNGSPCLLKT